MDKAKPLSICGLVIGTFLLTRNAGTSFAFDKPVHSSLFLLLSTAIALLVGSRWLPQEAASTGRGQKYDALPLSDVGQPHRSREPSPTPDDVRYPSSLRKLRICFIALACAICGRVVVTSYMVANVQCMVLSWKPLIPLALAIHDTWTSRQPQVELSHDSRASVSKASVQRWPASGIQRYVYAAALISLGSLLALSVVSETTSSFICASTLSNIWLVPISQRLGTLLDILILYCVSKLIDTHRSGGANSVSRGVGSIGWALLMSAAAAIIYGGLYTAFFTTPIQRKRLLEIPHYYVTSLINLAALTCFTVLSACIAISNLGITTTTCITTFVYICITTSSYAYDRSAAFPPTDRGWLFFGFAVLLLGFAGYIYLESASRDNRQRTKRLFVKKTPIWFWLILAALAATQLILWTSSQSIVNYHPLDLLLYDAEVAHEMYLNEAASSDGLRSAAQIYRKRYGRHPPPGFEQWYKYATDRDSIIVDAFDGIHDDLQPFWALPPREIRDRTWQLMSNPWHDASGLSIRNGKVEVSPSKFMMPTHAWMLEGLVKMISNFAEWLPDMDLAFNVNDECRVAVPFEAIDEMRNAAESTANLQTRVSNAFSADRASAWTPLPDEPRSDRVMRELSWQKTFDKFGDAACPPQSAARSQRHVAKGQLCTSCTAPHSIGAFLSNWTLAHDIRHQPDMADYHGIYLAPAAFKATHDLYPVFSQSKVSGFNDILYPSAWNYIDKARYEPTAEFPDPPFANKNATLFWRGATSEGFSSGHGQWKGMARQRFVHLANGVNGTSDTQHPILLPHDSGTPEEPKYRYRNLPASVLTALLPTDVHIVESIARCGGPDCPDQAHEFAPLVPPTDFQTHWSYKYLLDLDGAGFSGRFLPFLQSRSLPFKASVFREWWDDGRVTAWRHFVPLDIRGHGLWATLAYFAGMDGKAGGKRVVVEGHEREAERIAEAGREWAGQVLRKEDMEIYFFRLLLEWGRLTDDRREEIGYPD